MISNLVFVNLTPPCIHFSTLWKSFDNVLIRVILPAVFLLTFDTVDYSILLVKLAHYGIRGIANQWFKSYLTSHFQFVSVDNINSNLKSIQHGVSQGSVLGPLLFLLCINDLHITVKSSKTYHFADDTHLLYLLKTLEFLCKKVNRDLTLNLDKTEFVLFRPRYKPLQIQPFLKLSGKCIYPRKSVKAPSLSWWTS